MAPPARTPESRKEGTDHPGRARRRQPDSRRAFLRAGASGLAGGALAALAGCSQTVAPSANGSPGGAATGSNATTATPSNGRSSGGGEDAALPDSVGLEPLAVGFDAPVAVAFTPMAGAGTEGGDGNDSTEGGTDGNDSRNGSNGDTDESTADAGTATRAYIVDQSGVVSVVEDGETLERPFLDLRDSIEFGGEKGLLGFALHPRFAENRRLFVRYSTPRREGTPSNYSHTFVLAEFEATADGRRARRDSERTLLEIPEPQGNHNAGDIAFGPDGHLYVAVGDGGAANDQGRGHVDDWYGAVNGGNGQDVTENFLGSILRIDVDSSSNGKPYGIPADNPLVGKSGRDEHYAWGLRNPWRMSFDGEDLYVGDVGQGRYEEVDRVRNGGNYGWNVKEGAHCFRESDCPDRTPNDVRGGERLLGPVIEYPHSDADVSGISVIGGYVYRGAGVPGLAGRYVFADLNAKGRLFVATPTETDDELWPVRTLAVDGESALERVLSFGRDPDGELYVLGGGGGESGVYRIVPAG